MCTPARASIRDCRAIETTDGAHCTARPGPSKTRPAALRRRQRPAAEKLAFALEDPPQQIEIAGAALATPPRSRSPATRSMPRGDGRATGTPRSPTASRPDRRQTAGDRCPAARRTSRRECATRDSGLPRPSGSDRRCDASPASARESTAARRECRSRRSCASAPPRRRDSRPCAGTPTTTRETPDRRPPTARVPRGRPARPTRR